MSYDWNNRADRLSELAWVRTKDLTAFRTLATNNGFATVKGRADTVETWGKINFDCPFDVDRRFPKFGTWICIDSGDWPGKIGQLIGALNYKEASEQGNIRNDTNPGGKTENTRGNGKEKEEERMTTIGQNVHDKNQLAFFQALQRMADQSYRGDGAYDRHKFEVDFELHWSDEGSRESTTAGLASKVGELLGGKEGLAKKAAHEAEQLFKGKKPADTGAGPSK